MGVRPEATMRAVLRDPGSGHRAWRKRTRIAYAHRPPGSLSRN
jgi:hypothetical protein